MVSYGVAWACAAGLGNLLRVHSHCRPLLQPFHCRRREGLLRSLSEWTACIGIDMTLLKSRSGMHSAAMHTQIPVFRKFLLHHDQWSTHGSEIVWPDMVARQGNFVIFLSTGFSVCLPLDIEAVVLQTIRTPARTRPMPCRCMPSNHGCPNLLSMHASLERLPKES